MYMAGMVFLPPRGGFAFRHFSGAKLRKISETTPPFNDRNIFFAFKTKKIRKNIIAISIKKTAERAVISKMVEGDGFEPPNPM